MIYDDEINLFFDLFYKKFGLNLNNLFPIIVL